MSDDLANVSTNLTALANARARVRIDASKDDPETVGFVLAVHRARTDISMQQQADLLGLDLPTLADLAVEQRPGTGGQEMGTEQLAELYGANRDRLRDVFSHAIV